MQAVASDGADGDARGSAIAVDGDVAVVGASYATINGNWGQGAAYVFQRPPGGSWADAVQVAKLTASDGQGSEYFGYSVAIDGDVIAVGANQAKVSGAWNQGAVYVFLKPLDGWHDKTEDAKLVALDAKAYDYMASSIDIEGDMIVAGAQAHDVDGRSDQGRVYVFEKAETGWGGTFMESATLTASDGAVYDQLGISVAISGDTIVAGANKIDVSPHPKGNGSVYVFTKPGPTWAGNWYESAKLTASDGALCDRFGESVATDGNTIVVGATQQGSSYTPPEGTPIPAGNGKAYVFTKPGPSWVTGTETAILTASDGAAFSYFGYSVAVEGDLIIVGSYGADIDGKWDQGAAYVYAKPLSGWASGTETAKVTSLSGVEQDCFGLAVALYEGRLFIGAPYSMNGPNYPGALFVFE